MLKKTNLAIILAASALVGVTAVAAFPLSAAEQTASQDENPGVPAGVKKQAGHPAKKPIPTDQYGDPLPEGAVARLGAKRFRHEGLTMGLVYSSDGNYLVGCNFSGIVVWEAGTGKELYRLPGLLPAKLAVSPDATTLAIWVPTIKGDNATVTFWDLRSGKHGRVLSLPKGARVGQLCYSPDGKSLIANTTPDGTVVIFDLASGRLMSFAGGETRFYSVAVSPDSKTLATAVHPGNLNPTYSVQLWNLATKKLIRIIHSVAANNQAGYANTIAFSPDGKVLAFGGADRIFLFDPVTGKELGQLKVPMDQKIDVAFTPDGKKLVSSHELEFKVRVWDVATRKVLHTFEGRKNHIWVAFMALSPDGKTVAFGTPWNTLQLWDVVTGKELFTEYQGHFSQINDLAFSPNGKTLASSGGDGPILLWNTPSRKRQGIVPGNSVALAFSSDGMKLATAPGSYADASLRIWRMAAHKDALVAKISDAQIIQTVTFAPGDRTLFSVDWSYKREGKFRVSRWDATTGKQDKVWTIPDVFQVVSLGHDGKKVYSGTLRSDICIRDLDSDQERWLRGLVGESVNCLAPSPDGKLLASAMLGPITQVRLWETLTSKEIFLLKGHHGFVDALAWSPDGRLLAAGDKRADKRDPMPAQTVRLWDTATGKELAKFGGFQANVWALAFSPDGKTLAAGLQDSTILIYDVAQAVPKILAATKLGKDELESPWADLIGENAGTAHQALWSLIDAPKDSLHFLRGRLKPVAVADAGAIQRLIGNLNSDKFADRQAAVKELEKVGEQIQIPVNSALKADISLEARRRLEQILNKVADVPSPKTVRAIRAIMVLERIGSPEARVILQTLASGASGARETEEAKASLQRLAFRAHKTP